MHIYMIWSTIELLETELKYFEKVFVEKKNYPKWVIRQIFTQVKFINGSNLSLPTIETMQVPTNRNATVAKSICYFYPAKET